MNNFENRHTGQTFEECSDWIASMTLDQIASEFIEAFGTSDSDEIRARVIAYLIEIDCPEEIAMIYLEMRHERNMYAVYGLTYAEAQALAA